MRAQRATAAASAGDEIASDASSDDGWLDVSVPPRARSDAEAGAIVEEAHPIFRDAIKQAQDAVSSPTSEDPHFDGTAEEALIHKLLDESGADVLQQATKPALEQQYEKALAKNIAARAAK